MVERLFLTVPRGCLQFVIVVLPDHTHLLFLFLHFVWFQQKRIIPKVLADSDDHKKFKCFRFSTAVFLRDPILRKVVFIV